MKHYESTATINATPAQVWAILIDAPTWPTWDSGVTKVEGTITENGKLKITTEVTPRAFPVTAGDIQPNQGFTFTGGMPLGLFRGVRRYTLTETQTQTGTGTTFHLREEYTGPLLPLIWKSMPDLQPSFDRFAAGLKARAES
ncbi:SRPBCC domain-containing protein [Actinokineospora sp. NBRC 105648]|uniref:SRPBCC domain-containing protein n=1 Tax=Actinokineospora sp. NBRC 105648 TaxID=3032206 RepID=UPI0024A5ACD3|nr:SRPBCC domain-containing protein [Actinokineospora sp. NBRC 105648]GLZ43734.1 hypothetical protein Acsp05_73580 [Actinokineospora sp. NBRC 105648]